MEYLEDIANALETRFDTMYETEEIGVDVYTEGDRHILFKTSTCTLDILAHVEDGRVYFTDFKLYTDPFNISELYDVAYSIKLFYEVLEEFDGAELDDSFKWNTADYI